MKTKKPKIEWVANLIAKKCSYGGKRSKKNIDGIVIHYTDNVGDTAKNNVLFFSKQFGSNTQSAGAHFFVDQDGNIGRSIPMNRIAYAVGNKNGWYRQGSYYTFLNNANTVSIELCDNVDHYPSDAQVNAVIELVKYIRFYCPNAKTIVRHYDIVKKECPKLFVENEKKWFEFKNKIDVWG